jgi:hypothetical protein
MAIVLIGAVTATHQQERHAMKSKHHIARVAIVLVATLGSAGAVQALELYDTFRGVRLDGISGKHLDPELWEKWNSRGALQMVRTLSGGKVILKTVTHGDSGSDEGRNNGRSSLAFPESVGAVITEIQATVQTKKSELTDCPTNDDNGRLLTPRMGGFWFNDGVNVPADDEDQTGSVWAALDIRRRNHHDAITDPKDPMRRSNRLQVTASVFHCGDADCIDGDPIGDFVTLGIIKRGQKRRIRMQWDEANNQFLFQLHRDEPVAIAYDSALNAGPPPKFWKRIEHRGQPENCADPSARTTIMGEVRVFDVSVNDDAIAGP